jgi:dUTPase
VGLKRAVAISKKDCGSAWRIPNSIAVKVAPKSGYGDVQFVVIIKVPGDHVDRDRGLQ